MGDFWELMEGGWVHEAGMVAPRRPFVDTISRSDLLDPNACLNRAWKAGGFHFSDDRA
jgi:hypothetical protein